MKKNLTFCLLLMFVSQLFGYRIEKNYDSSLWDYQILATNESSYYTQADGTKKYYDTILIRDAKNKINYEIGCSSEADTLRTYYAYINKYKTAYAIKNELIPEIQNRVANFSTSDDGTWIFCSVYGYSINEADYLSDEDFLEIFEDKYEKGLFFEHKDELLILTLTLFDGSVDFMKSLINDDKETSAFVFFSTLEAIKNDCDSKKVEELKHALIDFFELSEEELIEIYKEMDY